MLVTELGMDHRPGSLLKMREHYTPPVLVLLVGAIIDDFIKRAAIVGRAIVVNRVRVRA